VKKGATIGEVPVADGQAKTVPAAAAADVSTLVQRGQEDSVKASLAPSSVTAPVRAGQQVGWIVVTQNGKQISKVPAVASASVEKQPWWKKFWPF
jgi:D-alanyl-D-alanine carboxypeptidase (penicillin-binding protein 5/6)